MSTLGEKVKKIRSKNAGPFWITIDIFCGNKQVYDDICINLDNLEPQKQVTCVITHSDGNKEEIVLNHSYNESQIQWFKHGSALNVLRNKK